MTAMLPEAPTAAPSALSAAISMGRFLARNPQFKSVDALKWQPRPSGEVLVVVRLAHPDAPALVRALGEALAFCPADPSPYTSPNTHLPMVSLTLRGEYDGARWRVDAQVPADAYASAMALRLTDPSPAVDLCACWDEFVRRGHNPDPLDWPAEERREYAAFVAAYEAENPGLVMA